MDGFTDPDMQVAGKLASLCPLCGSSLRVNRTCNVESHHTIRYTCCTFCEAVFLSSQPPAILVRLVTPPPNSNIGMPTI